MSTNPRYDPAEIDVLKYLKANPRKRKTLTEFHETLTRSLTYSGTKEELGILVEMMELEGLIAATGGNPEYITQAGLLALRRY